MLTIIMAITIALLLGFIVLMKSRSNDPAQLNEPRPSLLTIGVQIICGDCSGDDERATKTYLDRFGTCSHCGGRSYVLASALAANGVLSRAARLREAYLATSHGRVLSFDMHGSRGSRSEKIAV